jgi:hypothetical protein
MHSDLWGARDNVDGQLSGRERLQWLRPLAVMDTEEAR